MIRDVEVSRARNLVMRVRHNDRTSDPGYRSPITASRARGRQDDGRDPRRAHANPRTPRDDDNDEQQAVT